MSSIKCIVLILSLLTPPVATAAAEAEPESARLSGIDPDPGTHLFPQVEKLDNRLYTWPVNATLCGCMERVTEGNIDLWQHFGETEERASAYPVPLQTQKEDLWRQLFEAEKSGADKGSIEAMQASYKKIFSDLKMLEGLQNGSKFFCQMLKNVDYAKYELWVCYITSGEPQHIPDSIMDYKDPYTQPHQDFAQNIKMFVTVTSHPDALFTSHVGIAATVYRTLASMQSKEVPVSIDLHSGAAKVMLMRNPNRRYTINQPTPDMANRLVRAIDTIAPHSAFIGTRAQYRKAANEQAAQKTMTLEQFRDSDYNSLCWAFKAGVPSETRAWGEERLPDKYNEWKLSSYLTERLATLNSHMPILEEEHRQPWPSMTLTIFEPNSDEIWLRADTDNPAYGWISNSANMTAPYLAVNLNVLAHAR